MESLQYIAKNICQFCDEIENKTPDLLGLSKSICSNRVFSTQYQNIFVIPDASPMTWKHGLIIPKTHVSKFSQLYCSSLAKIVQHVVNNLFEDENLIFFEHGGHSCLRHGLCTEHAHLHIVVVKKFCISRFISTLYLYGGKSINKYNSLDDVYTSDLLKKSEDYLIFGYANRIAYDAHIIDFDYVPSQVLRYVLAETLDISPHISLNKDRANAFRNSYLWLKQLFKIETIHKLRINNMKNHPIVNC